MREILFKAKRIKDGKWIEGYLFDNGFSGEEKKYFVGVLIIEKYNGTACDEWDITGIDFCEIDPKTLCQFTGLYDRYGNKIWENDILKTWSDEYAQVKFGFYDTGFASGDYNQGFYVYFSEESFLRKELGYWCKETYVIGNVFDNPDILQEESDE